MTIPFYLARMKEGCVLYAPSVMAISRLLVLPTGNISKANLENNVMLPIFFFFSSKNIKANTISFLAIISHEKEYFTKKEIEIRKFENEEPYIKLNRLY